MDMLQRTTPAKYAAAILMIGSAVFLRWALVPWLGTVAPYIFIYPAAMLAGIHFGLGPSLVAVGLGVAATELWVAETLSFALLFRISTIYFIVWLTAYMGRRLEEAKKRLQVENERLQLAMASTNMGTFDSNLPEGDLAKGQPVWSNSTKRLFGLAAATPVSYALFLRLLHPEDRPAVENAIRQALRPESAGRYQVEYRIRRLEDGQERWIAANGQVWFNAQGRPQRFLGMVLDVTERKRTEEELRLADRRKSDFLAMLAHELRNLLVPIRNAVQLLRMKDVGDPFVRRQRDLIERQVVHMARLLDDLLDLSRIGRGHIILHRRRVAITEIFSRALEMAGPWIAGRQQALEVAQSQGLAVEGDPDRLTQVVANLLTNAAKYTPTAGHIWLKAGQEDGEAVIRVRDDGMGIAPESLTRIFDLFMQAERAQDRASGGLGIGLAIVRDLVRLHGGRVEAASPGLGKGSEFVVRLPAATSGRPEELPGVQA